jgi:hypothetical protein
LNSEPKTIHNSKRTRGCHTHNNDDFPDIPDPARYPVNVFSEEKNGCLHGHHNPDKSQDCPNTVDEDDFFHLVWNIACVQSGPLINSCQLTQLFNRQLTGSNFAIINRKPRHTLQAEQS